MENQERLVDCIKYLNEHEDDVLYFGGEYHVMNPNAPDFIKKYVEEKNATDKAIEQEIETLRKMGVIEN